MILDEAIRLTDDDGNTFEKDNAALKKYFDIFNRTYFNGVLADIPLEWTKAECTHGQFESRPDIKNRRRIPIKIKLNINASGTYAAFRNVFVHEMLHYYVACHVPLPERNWEYAEYAALRGDRLSVKKALHTTPETAHGFEWGRLAAEMSEKYPELGNLERYAVRNNETGVAMMDRDYVINWGIKNVVLKWEKDGATRYYVMSANSDAVSRLMKYFETGETPITYLVGKWTRIFVTLDPAKFTRVPLCKDFNRYLSRFPQDMIRKEKELGTLKPEGGEGGVLYDSAQIQNWCRLNVMLRKKKNGRTQYYIISRNGKEYQEFMSAIRRGYSNNIYLEGDWAQIYPTHDPKYFRLYKSSRSFMRYYMESQVPSTFISIIDELGKIEFKIEFR